jgi:hypothetical protein
MNLFIFFKESDVASFNKINIRPTRTYCVKGSKFPKDTRKIDFDLYEFYLSNFFLKSYMLISFYIKNDDFKKISNQRINLYCSTDNALIRLIVSILMKKNTVRINLIYNFVLNESPKSKIVKALNIFLKKQKLYFVSSFFPSILGIYADKIYSKFDDTIFQFKRHLESSQKEYILEDNSASINASEHFEYKVGIFLSAWEYHGFKYEENFQNEAVRIIQENLIKNSVSFFIRPHPHQKIKGTSFLNLSTLSYSADTARCEYIVSIGSTALFEKTFSNQYVRKIPVDKIFLKLDRKFTELPCLDYDEL